MNIKEEIQIIKIEADFEENIPSCAACKILTYYMNKDVFISSVVCIFCDNVIEKTN